MPFLNNSLFIPIFEGYCRQNQIDGKDISAKIGDFDLKLKVCSTPESMMRGYSGRPAPKESEGMIFVYQQDQPLEFWMKGVDYPLDILFFNSSMALVDFLTMDPCGSSKDEGLPKYKSSKPAMFAVEVPAGWCESNKISKNCRLKF